MHLLLFPCFFFHCWLLGTLIALVKHKFRWKCVDGIQVLDGGAPCQQIDSEEDDDQEAEVEDEVDCS